MSCCCWGCVCSFLVAVQEELKGKDVLLLVEAGLKTKEDIGELLVLSCQYYPFILALVNTLNPFGT